MASVPLIVAYVALPLAMALVHLVGSGPVISPFLPWLLLAGVGTMWAMLFRRSGVPVKKRFYFEVLSFLVLGALLYLRQDVFVAQMALLLPLIVEMAPVGILGFCLLWVMTFGTPDRAAFQRYGGVLGLLCLIDLVVEVAMTGTVPGLRWLGDVDMLAGLLLISLCASLRPGENDGGLSEPDQGHRVWRVLILLGLVACLSRTGLFGAGWIFLCFGRGTRVVRILVAVCFFLLIGLTFVLPAMSFDALRYVDYWLWAKSVALFSQDPLLLLTGVPMDQALPFVFPPELAAVWERATNSSTLFGVHLPHVRSFWLRAILGWGALIPMAALVALFVLLFRRLTRMGAGLAAALFAQGMSTPLLYDPTLGVTFGLALFLALSTPKSVTDARKDSGADRAETAPEPDPAREWDMRPL